MYQQLPLYSISCTLIINMVGVVDCVAGCVPIWTVDKTSFRNMLSALDPRYECPGRNVFTKTVIPTMYNSSKEEVSRLVQKAHW